MPHLDRDGVAIHYESTGSGPAVLLTHGFAASSRMFASNVDALAKDHTVVTWDLRGHGRSDYPDDQSAYSAALSIEDMAALLETVGADRGVLMGHSLGGYLSLEFHVRFPERVAGLVLVGTGPGFRNDEARDGWNQFAAKYSSRLHERGLDREVVVLVWGEFGRTPRVNNVEGRDHWPDVGFALFSGGGLRTGQVVGETDRKGEQPKNRPVGAQNVLGTVYHALGVPPDLELRDRLDRPLLLVPEGAPIQDVFA